MLMSEEFLKSRVQESSNQSLIKYMRPVKPCLLFMTFARSQGALPHEGGAQNATNFEDDFGKYASPYLISHLTSTTL